jgi:hypothetical protein
MRFPGDRLREERPALTFLFPEAFFEISNIPCSPLLLDRHDTPSGRRPSCQPMLLIPLTEDAHTEGELTDGIPQRNGHS